MKRFFTRLLQGLVVVVALAGAVLFFASRDRAATHTELRNTALPPLIPVRDFHADPFSNWGYQPSFDGKLVSYRSSNFLGQSLRIKDVATGREIARLPFDIYAIRWHPDQPLIRFKQGGKDYEVDPLAADPENWRDISLPGFDMWNRVAYPLRADDDILVTGKRHKRSPTGLYRVTTDGTVTRLETATKQTLRWITNGNNTVRLRAETIDGFTHKLQRKQGDTWVDLLEYNVNDTFAPVGNAFPADGPQFLSSRGRDTTALVRLDMATGDETVLFNNPDYDILKLYHFGRGAREIDALTIETDRRKIIAFTDRGRAFKTLIDAHGTSTWFNPTGMSSDGRYVTVALTEHQQSFRYFRFDLDTTTETHLGDFGFRRHADKLTEIKIVRFTARDGLSIPAYLSLPKGVTGPIPFIVRIHGGPAGGEALRYNHEVQFLNNRGYGTLDVNFRGSVGYGRAFQSAGFRQFGRAMQDDIADAARWLAEQNLADPDKIAVMGTSYGGYSAALAITRDPGLFAAAIVEFPMLDTEFQSRHYPEFWNNSIGGWTRYFGDPQNPQDLALMRQHSPINHIDALSAPVLLISGKRDKITGYQQAERFDAAARAAGHDITTHVFENAGHGLSNWKDKVTRARLLEDFLALHLGGRSGRFDYSELAPDFIQ